MSKPDYDPDWIPPPGATVEDLLARDDGTKSRSLLAMRLGTARAEQLFTGQLPIDAEIARILISSVGLSAAFWLEREKLYRSAVAQRKAETHLLSELPLGEMKKRQFIRPQHSHAETVAEVVEFFGNDDFDSCREQIDRLPDQIKQKTSQTIVSSPGALAVWIRAGELEADKIECERWDPDRLREMLPDLRKLTRAEDPQKYLPALRAACQQCGVAFVVLRAFTGCKARGAVKLLSPSKAMLLVSYRHLSDDQFWFSFFHELAHLLLHADVGIIVDDGDDGDDVMSREEADADDFAANTLVPPEHQPAMSMLQDDRSIIQFSRRVGVSRGIVVGQMQHRKIVDFGRFNHLKMYYRWGANDRIEKKPKGV